MSERKRKGEKSRRRRGQGRTWRIVSKLKVRPFQRVNSPEVDPVSTRRASGVHCAGFVRWGLEVSLPSPKFESSRESAPRRTFTILTGQRILLVEVWA